MDDEHGRPTVAWFQTLAAVSISLILVFLFVFVSAFILLAAPHDVVGGFVVGACNAFLVWYFARVVFAEAVRL